ncbi:protein of unknown function (plasmid) [Shinella sp. WSC3-e]|nr:protein of unknown function [Shinella sp. WSC3-e]
MTVWTPDQLAVGGSDTDTGTPESARYPNAFRILPIPEALSAATVLIPVSAAVVTPVVLFPAIAAAPFITFTDVAYHGPSRATGGGSHRSAFPSAACQPTNDSAARRTDAGALFRLAARCQRQTNEYA